MSGILEMIEMRFCRGSTPTPPPHHPAPTFWRAWLQGCMHLGERGGLAGEVELLWAGGGGGRGGHTAHFVNLTHKSSRGDIGSGRPVQTHRKRSNKGRGGYEAKLFQKACVLWVCACWLSKCVWCSSRTEVMKMLHCRGVQRLPHILLQGAPVLFTFLARRMKDECWDLNKGCFCEEKKSLNCFCFFFLSLFLFATTFIWLAPIQKSWRLFCCGTIERFSFSKDASQMKKL